MTFTYNSPLGFIKIEYSERGISGLVFTDDAEGEWHRAGEMGSDGSLTGYAGGLWRKQWLLEHESRDQILF